jgi:hypothetical protein
VNYKPYYSCGRLEKPLEHCQDKSFAELNRRNLKIAYASECIIPNRDRVLFPCCELLNNHEM